MKLVVTSGRLSKRASRNLMVAIFFCALLAAWLAGCQGEPSPTQISPTATSLGELSATALPEIGETALFPALTPAISATDLPGEATPILEDTPYPSSDATLPSGSISPYPGVEAAPLAPSPYPGVQSTPTNPAYPVVQTTQFSSISTDTAYPQPLVSPSADIESLPTSDTKTPETAIAPDQTQTAERVIVPLGTPPAYGGTVTIWHSWSSSEAAALMQVVAAFQKSYPEVRFDLLVLPESDLLTRYEVESYNGGGPSLLIGPSDWTAYLIDRQLVENLTPYVSSVFSRTIFPAALGTGQYRDQLACLPLNLSGVLLYRNKQIIPEPADSLDELLAQATSATRAGKVGAYLDRGFSFSFAHLYGLGGRLVDDNGAPAFQEQDYRFSLAWIDLLRSFEQPGAYAFNDEKDTSLFKQNRAGYLIDGSWNLNTLANAIGAENLAIDPFPSIPQGYLSGYVKAESLYLNINTARISSADHLATLRFMGYLMTAPVQEYLAELGYIPSLLTARSADPLLLQAHAALARSTAYPPVLFSRDGAVLFIYQDTLNAALLDILYNAATPRPALERAFQDITQRLEALK